MNSNVSGELSSPRDCLRDFWGRDRLRVKQDESTTKTLKRKPNVSKSFSSSFNCKGRKPTIVNTKPLCDEVIIHRNKKEQNKPRLSIEESNKEPEHLSFKCRREMWEQRTT